MTLRKCLIGTVNNPTKYYDIFFLVKKKVKFEKDGEYMRKQKIILDTKFTVMISIDGYQ